MREKRDDLEDIQPTVDPEAGDTESAVVEPEEAGADAPADGEPATDPGGELRALEDRYLRLAAEYDNFRKRTGRERAELRARAQGDLAATLLDALDDLGRVADLDPAVTAARDVIAGVELVERKMLRQLEGAGLERIAEVEVPFDPNQHEAIAQLPAEAPEQDHTVAAVFQVGYRFGGQLLRPARVQVRVWRGESGAV